METLGDLRETMITMGEGVGNSPLTSGIDDHIVELVGCKTLAIKSSSGQKKKKAICSLSLQTLPYGTSPPSRWGHSKQFVYPRTFFPNMREHQ